MALIFEVSVAPSSGRNGWTFNKSGKLKCFLKSPPEKGKANKELIMIIAKALRIPQQDVEILSGHIITSKRVQVMSDITYEQLLEKLGIERQMMVFGQKLG